MCIMRKAKNREERRCFKVPPFGERSRTRAPVCSVRDRNREGEAEIDPDGKREKGGTRHYRRGGRRE